MDNQGIPTVDDVTATPALCDTPKTGNALETGNSIDPTVTKASDVISQNYLIPTDQLDRKQLIIELDQARKDLEYCDNNHIRTITRLVKESKEINRRNNELEHDMIILREQLSALNANQERMIGLEKALVVYEEHKQLKEQTEKDSALLKSLREEKVVLESAYVELQQQLKQVREDLTGSKKQTDELSVEISRLNNEHCLVSYCLKQEKEHNVLKMKEIEDKWIKQVKSLEKEMKRLRRTGAKDAFEIHELLHGKMNVLIEQFAENDLLRSNRVELLGKVQELQKKCETAKEEATDLKEHVGSLSDFVNSSKDVITKYEQSRKQIKELQRENKDLCEKKAKQQCLAVNSKQINDTLIKKCDKLEKQCRIMVEQNEQLKSKILERDQVLKQQNDSITRATRIIDRQERYQDRVFESLDYDFRCENEQCKFQTCELTFQLDMARIAPLLELSNSLSEKMNVEKQPLKIAEEFTALTSTSYVESIFGTKEVEKAKLLCEILMESQRIAKAVHAQLQHRLALPLADEKRRSEKIRAIFSSSTPPSGTSEQLLLAAAGNSFGDFIRTSAHHINVDAFKEVLVASLKAQLGPNWDTLISAFTGRSEVTLFINQSARLVWKMVLQRPQMTFDTPNVGQPWTGRTAVDLMWGSKPDAPRAKILYYRIPILRHGDKVLGRGIVFAHGSRYCDHRERSDPNCAIS